MVVSELYQATGRLATEFPWLKVAKYFDKVDSTQKRIVQFLPKEDDGAVLILSETQSKGVGRQGRPWASPSGGIWFTLALPMKKMDLAKAASFSPLSALVVSDALKAVYNLSTRIKWPNDVLYEGKKVAGILLGSVAKFKKSWLLVGVGVNVNNELPGDLKSIATSIKAIRGQSQGRSRLIEAVIGALWTAWEEFDRSGFGPYHAAAVERLEGVGKPTSVLVGKKTLEGTLDGIDPQGNLLLKSAAGSTTISAGEIVG